MGDALLEARDVTVRFGGKTALNETTVTAEPGRITGLIGPNGAGKTTLFNVVCGLQGANSGRVLLDGHDVTRLPPHKRARRGLARTFQRLELFTSLTVRDNVRVGGDIHNRWNRTPGRLGRRRADEVLALTGLAAHRRPRGVRDPDRPGPRGRAGPCPHDRAEGAAARRARRRARATRRPRRSVTCCAAWPATGWRSCLVEHDMTLVMDVCETIHVLDYGRMIAVGPPDAVRADPAVVEAYLGTPEGVG